MSQAISILYFASLGEGLNCASEEVALTQTTTTVGALKAQLAERGPLWQAQLLKASVRAAVNQTIVDEDTELKPGDELAFFPPVTGG